MSRNDKKNFFLFHLGRKLRSIYDKETMKSNIRLQLPLQLVALQLPFRVNKHHLVLDGNSSSSAIPT